MVSPSCTPNFLCSGCACNYSSFHLKKNLADSGRQSFSLQHINISSRYQTNLNSVFHTLSQRVSSEY